MFSIVCKLPNKKYPAFFSGHGATLGLDNVKMSIANELTSLTFCVGPLQVIHSECLQEWDAHHHYPRDPAH